MTANARRREFLQAALMDVPKNYTLLGYLDLEGPPDLVASGVVTAFDRVGEIVPGKTALEFLLRALIDSAAGLNEQEFLRGLLEELHTAAPVVSGALTDADWRGEDNSRNAADTQEKVIQENTLQHVYILGLALEASAAVCHIAGPLGMGTGFLVAPDLIATNNHVISDSSQLAQCEFMFRYELTADGTAVEPIAALAEVGGPFFTSQELDLTLLRLRPDHSERLASISRPLALRAQQMEAGDRVAIIQHPGGLYKQISYQNNKVQYADNRIVQYTTTTLPGSSGSPVFNSQFEVIAIHSRGGNLQQPDNRLYYFRNQGTSVTAIAIALRDHVLRGKLTIRH